MYAHICIFMHMYERKRERERGLTVKCAYGITILT